MTGTFNSPDLFVLSYDALDSELSIRHTVRAEGPHQYLALGVSSTGAQTVYATTWGAPSALSAWYVSSDDYNLSFGNRREITATGSYVHVQPPPYFTQSAPGFGGAPGVARWLGSAGGPTGELHRLDAETGAIGERVKELVFLAGGEKELAGADKTRKALRYGAHSFDCSPAIEENASDSVSASAVSQVAFVADLGANAVQAYTFPALEHLYTIASAEEGDGPRHAIPHPHHPLVFTVTEHTNYVDAYQVPAYASPIELDKRAGATHVARADMLAAPQAANRHEYRGDTLRFSSDLQYIFATTRGKTAETKGLLIAYRLSISAPTAHSSTEAGEYAVQLTEVARFETRTSGGKANAIELAPHSGEGGDLMVLTDDEQGWMDILFFDTAKETFELRATTQLPALEDGQAQGASHAIWLL